MAETSTTNGSGSEEDSSQEKSARRKIPGGLPYTSSPGVLRRVLERIPTSEKPATFNPDFLATVMGATGGASRPIIPILKSAGFLNQSGAPTEIYAQFQTDSGRANAALQALKIGFSEIFRRNQYAHRADEPALVDIIVSITGLPKKDSIVRYILATFQVFQDSAKNAREDVGKSIKDAGDTPDDTEATTRVEKEATFSTLSGNGKIHLAYNINIVLPETTNIEVYNAIFRSLKGNILT